MSSRWSSEKPPLYVLIHHGSKEEPWWLSNSWELVRCLVMTVLTSLSKMTLFFGIGDGHSAVHKVIDLLYQFVIWTGVKISISMSWFLIYSIAQTTIYLRLTRTSIMGIDVLFLVSIVNCISRCWLVRWSRKSCKICLLNIPSPEIMLKLTIFQSYDLKRSPWKYLQLLAIVDIP